MTGGHLDFESRLVERGFLGQSDVADAREHAAREGVSLADAVVALGLVSERDSYAVLAEACGLRLVSLDDLVVSELALRLVPERFARRRLVVPLNLDNGVLTYASCGVLDIDVERGLSSATGRRATGVLAPRSAVMAALDKGYPQQRELERVTGRLRSVRTTTDTASVDGTESSSAAPVVDFCHELLARAVELEASDVHVETTSGGCSVRYRICGVLEQVMAIPASASRPVSDRFKIMAGADISVRNRPQDGSFRLSAGGRPVDVRLSSRPTIGGETLVMRVIDGQNTPKDLDALGYDADMLAQFKQSLSRPDGLVVVTGPTGCGKTTALYAVLNYLSTGGTNVVMVGDVRDAEVAHTVAQAACTGHLVLTSLHTADAATAVTRLMDLGIEPVTVADRLTAVVAQRLVRRLCPHCRRSYDDLDAQRRGNAHRLPAIPVGPGPGCERCHQTGYLGRVPIAELLTPSDAVRATIARGAAARDIRAAMRAAGMRSMRQRALELVAAGVTSIDEVHRVLAADQRVTSAPRSRHRVLVADDEPTTRLLVKVLLEREQFEVLEAANGREAVEIAARERPDLLLIDLNMPELDGYQAITQLRRGLAPVTMPIIVLTAETGPGVERRVIDLGADDYIPKPFDPGVLLARVQSALRRDDAMVA